MKVYLLALTAFAAHDVAWSQALPPTPPPASQVPLEPVAASKITYVGQNGIVQESYWAAIPEKEKRKLLNSAEAFVQIRKITAGGGVAALPVNVKIDKGSYRLLFRWQQYRADYCLPNKPDAGRVRTGVALEIDAEVTTKKSGINILNLGALTGAAERDQVEGSIRIKQIGLGNTSPTLNTYLANFELTREGVTKALEAIAVTKAVLENDATILTPHYLSYTEATPGSCSAIQAQSLPLAG